MSSNFYLILHNVVSIGSAVVLFGVAFFAFLNGPKKTANIIFSLFIISANIFVISHVVGVNIVDPNLSRIVFMFNLSMFFIGAFFLHTVFIMVGKDRGKLWMIIFVYLSSIIFIIMFSLSPDLLFLPSVPKMYFPNYYNPGLLNLVRVLFLYVVVVPYSLYLLYVAFKSEIDIKRKKQYKFFIIFVIIGFGIGFIPNFLVYNISIDPLWGMPFAVLAAVPFTYAAIRYELLNIRVIAKQAFAYSVAVVIVGGLITLLNYSNKWIQAFYSSFPDWITSLVSSLLAVTIGVVIWRQLRQGDLLKYEFITIIIHKFRTPLTEIKWSIDELCTKETDPEKLKNFEDMKNSNKKLIDLTSTLVELSDPGKSSGALGRFEKISLCVLLQDVVDSYKDNFSRKNINFVFNCPTDDVMVNVDKERVKFVIQTLLENAFAYTPQNGKVSLLLESSGGKAYVSMIDNGIGISKDNLNLIFTRFFRTENAKKMDTEGFGIGLYLSRSIAKRHGGDIKVFSDGEDKGSTLKLILPKV